MSEFTPGAPGGAFDIASGTCSWPVTYANGAPPEVLESMDDNQRLMFEAMAGQYLWMWTGQRFGTCSVTLRPCRSNGYLPPNIFEGRGPFTTFVRTGYIPAIIAGAYYAIACTACGVGCLCDSTKSLTLPGPIASIDAVKVDGVTLDPSAYRVDNQRHLVRIDGEAWPTSQDMTLATTEVNTFEVSYQRGLGVPYGGQVAAGRLALELALAALDRPECALPQRVQSITRQGVTVAVIDAFDDVGTGRTGIWLIDSWVASVTAPPSPARVYSVDVGRPKNRSTLVLPGD